jgi:hypothetical protein
MADVVWFGQPWPAFVPSAAPLSANSFQRRPAVTIVGKRLALVGECPGVAMDSCCPLMACRSRGQQSPAVAIIMLFCVIESPPLPWRGRASFVLAGQALQCKAPTHPLSHSLTPSLAHSPTHLRSLSPPAPPYPPCIGPPSTIVIQMNDKVTLAVKQAKE